MYVPETLTAKAINDIVTDHFKKFDPRKLRANLFLGIAFPEQSGNSRNLRLGWVFAVTASRNALQLVRGFPYVQEERATRIPGLAGLDAFRVAVVGCGCLGSKIAVALAASGVEKFTLIDKDIVEPYNSVRSELGVPLFGLPKPIGLRLRILEANPAASGRFVEIRHSIGATNPMSSEQHVVEQIVGADLVIDATGSHGVNRWLNQLACEKRVGAIYVSVTNGAWSGEIVRVKPSDPCWACWNAQYESDSPPGAAADPVYPPGCDQPSFAGTTFDTGIVANLACAVAVQTLLGVRFSLPPYPQQYLRWIGRDWSGAPVLRAETLPIHRRPDCPSCNGW
jgi:molybdopterin/thiamine biosynthesis adenylyltransferase